MIDTNTYLDAELAIVKNQLAQRRARIAQLIAGARADLEVARRQGRAKLAEDVGERLTRLDAKLQALDAIEKRLNGPRKEDDDPDWTAFAERQRGYDDLDNRGF